MSSRLGPRLVALLFPAVLLAPAAAHAERVVTHDPAGDAGVLGWLADEDAELPATPDPSPADIVRTVAAHGDRRLSITVHLTELAGVREHADRTGYESHPIDLVLDGAISPAWRQVTRVSREARLLQAGRLRWYLLYVILTVLALLLYIGRAPGAAR